MYKYFNIKIECFSAKYTTYKKSMYTVCTNKYRPTNGFIRYMKSFSPGVLVHKHVKLHIITTKSESSNFISKVLGSCY